MDQNRAVKRLKSDHNSTEKNILEKCMENLPHIATTIFGYLDNKSLCQSRQVEKSWLNFIESQKFYWKRVTQDKLWDLTISKIDSKATQILGECFLGLAKYKAVKYRKHFSPIFCAIALDNIDLFKMLLEKISSSIFSTPAFHEAVRRGKVEYVKHFLRHGIDHNATSFRMQETPLHTAVKNSRLKVISVLLEDSLTEDKPDLFGITALHVAAQEGKVDCVKALLSSEKINRNPRSEEIWRDTPLHLAVRHNHPEVVSVLLDDPLVEDLPNACGKFSWNDKK